jgi:hypothetical protein
MKERVGTTCCKTTKPKNRENEDFQVGAILKMSNDAVLTLASTQRMIGDDDFDFATSKTE